MLRGLTERPNVQSTLILSRRDGSIIRATGVAAAKTPKTSPSTIGVGGRAGAPYPQDPQTHTGNAGQTPVEGGNDVATQNTAEATETSAQEKTPEPVELLAASIFQFVSNADALGVTLGTVTRGAVAGAESGTALYGENARHDGGRDEEFDQTRGEDDVQLLRLRTKHQEIIIFPDPKYICCVVQRMGKTATGASTHR